MLTGKPPPKQSHCQRWSRAVRFGGRKGAGSKPRESFTMPGKKGSMNKSSDIEMTNRNPQPDGGTVNGRPNTTAASDAYEQAHPGSKQAATNDIKRLMNTADTSLTYKRKGSTDVPNMWLGLDHPSRTRNNKRAGDSGPGMMEVPDYVKGGQEVYAADHPMTDPVAPPLQPHEKVGNQLQGQAPTRANKLKLDNYGGYGDVGPLASSTIENYFDPTGPSGHGSEETREEKIKRYRR